MTNNTPSLPAPRLAVFGKKDLAFLENGKAPWVLFKGSPRSVFHYVNNKATQPITVVFGMEHQPVFLLFDENAEKALSPDTHIVSQVLSPHLMRGYLGHSMPEPAKTMLYQRHGMDQWFDPDDIERRVGPLLSEKTVLKFGYGPRFGGILARVDAMPEALRPLLHATQQQPQANEPA